MSEKTIANLKIKNERKLLSLQQYNTIKEKYVYQQQKDLAHVVQCLNFSFNISATADFFLTKL